MRTEQFKLDIQRYTELMIRGGYQRSFAQAMYSIYIYIYIIVFGQVVHVVRWRDIWREGEDEKH